MNKKRWTAIVAVTVLIVLIGWILISYANWKREMIARLRAGSQIIQTSRGPIEYATAGEGPVVLGVHGSPGGFDQTL